jgi:hypothetical protein
MTKATVRNEINPLTRKGESVKITKEDYPHLWEACMVIVYDNSGVPTPYCPLPDPKDKEFELNIGPKGAGIAEEGLSQLSEDDFETFCIGEESEQIEIRDRVFGLRIASSVLNEWFDEGMP